MLLRSYKFGSKSGKALAEALGAKRIKHKGSKFIGRAHKTVINWGCSVLPEEVLKCKVLNDPDLVGLAANKKDFFLRLDDYNMTAEEGRKIYHPDFTSDKAIAAQWLADGATVVERHKLTGNSGEGIVICEPDGELGNAKLYTKYVPKKNEYRVHVVNGQPIDIQRKARVKDLPDDQINWKVRNMDGGFIFARNEDHQVPPVVAHQGVLAVEALRLDFGAVDVIYNDKKGVAYVLEVNTAPGLAGTTLDNYVEALNEHFS